MSLTLACSQELILYSSTVFICIEYISLFVILRGKQWQKGNAKIWDYKPEIACWLRQSGLHYHTNQTKQHKYFSSGYGATARPRKLCHSHPPPCSETHVDGAITVWSVAASVKERSTGRLWQWNVVFTHTPQPERSDPTPQWGCQEMPWGQNGHVWRAALKPTMSV